MNSTMSTGTHKWNICHQQILAPTNLNDFMVDYKFIIRKSPVTACIDDRVWSSDIKFILFGQNMCENYMIPWNISQLYILKISPKLYWCLIFVCASFNPCDIFYWVYNRITFVHLELFLIVHEICALFYFLLETIVVIHKLIKYM